MTVVSARPRPRRRSAPALTTTSRVGPGGRDEVDRHRIDQGRQRRREAAGRSVGGPRPGIREQRGQGGDDPFGLPDRPGTTMNVKPGPPRRMRHRRAGWCTPRPAPRPAPDAAHDRLERRREEDREEQQQQDAAGGDDEARGRDHDDRPEGEADPADRPAGNVGTRGPAGRRLGACRQRTRAVPWHVRDRPPGWTASQQRSQGSPLADRLTDGLGPALRPLQPPTARSSSPGPRSHRGRPCPIRWLIALMCARSRGRASGSRRASPAGSITQRLPEQLSANR